MLPNPTFSHFQYDEFACKCCGRNVMDVNTVKKFDMARRISGTPFVVSSGYRCSKHNAEVGGDSHSGHLSGLAADFKYSTSLECFLIVSSLLKSGITRIGIGELFVHADTDLTKPQNVIWNYYAKS